MKYVPSIAFDKISGSAKGVTAAKVRDRKYIRNRGYGGSVRTSAQTAVKSIFKQLSQSWKNLTIRGRRNPHPNQVHLRARERT